MWAQTTGLRVGDSTSVGRLYGLRKEPGAGSNVGRGFARRLECQTILKETDIAEASFLTGEVFDTGQYPVNRRGSAASREAVSAARRGLAAFQGRKHAPSRDGTAWRGPAQPSLELCHRSGEHRLSRKDRPHLG